MKNDQKNPIYPSVPFSCMLEQLIAAVQHKSIKWHLNNHIWSLNLNLVFKPTSFKSQLGALAQITSYCHVIIMHHIVHCIDCVSPLFVGACPHSVDDVPMMSSMTPMKSYTIFRSARQAKPPCSFRYNPTLSLLLYFTALGQLPQHVTVESLLS